MVDRLPASERPGGWASGAPLLPPPVHMAADPQPSNGAPVEIVLDLTRLLSGMLRCAPTATDRIELAYARALKQLVPGQLRYAAVHPGGAYGRLPAAAVEAFLDRLEGRWETVGARCPRIAAHRFALRQCFALRPRHVPPALGPRVLLQISPHHLHDPRAMYRKLRHERARFVCLVSDLAPAAQTAAAPTGSHACSLGRLKTIEALADGILLPSQAMLDALLVRADTRLQHLPVRIERLGVELRRAPASAHDDQPPYFLCVGPIEPRTNHPLLLHLWRSIVEAVGKTQAPRLLLVGGRGWQHQAVVDRIGRCPDLPGVVEELPPLPDCELRNLLRGARAVLKPAFAVDSGMPLTAALACGAPVLASDIPAHREAGGSIPDYLDPIDGDGWRAAILAYQAPASPRRQRQLERIAAWRPTTWREHVKTALSLIEEVATC